jgi:hypothetical protein
MAPAPHERDEHGLSDTSPAARRVLIEGFRRMPGWQKLQRVEELTQLVAGLALADIRRRYPDADERELTLRLAVRRLGADLVYRATGWDARVEGY